MAPHPAARMEKKPYKLKQQAKRVVLLRIEPKSQHSSLCALAYKHPQPYLLGIDMEN